MWESILLTVAATAGNNIGKILQKKGTIILPPLSFKFKVKFFPFFFSFLNFLDSVFIKDLTFFNNIMIWTIWVCLKLVIIVCILRFINLLPLEDWRFCHACIENELNWINKRFCGHEFTVLLLYHCVLQVIRAYALNKTWLIGFLMDIFGALLMLRALSLAPVSAMKIQFKGIL